jgi:hypothetical protein
MQSGGCTDFYVILFAVVYLTSCDFTMDPTKAQRVSIKLCANLGNSEPETLDMIREALGKESMALARVLK